MNRRLGLCCLIVGDEKTNFKSLKLKSTQTVSDKEDKLFSVYRHNLKELCRVVDYLLANNIMHYRIPSSLCPLADHPNFKYIWEHFCSRELEWKIAKSFIKKYLDAGGRLSTHPDQFCIISSANESTNAKGIEILEYHAKFFDMLEIPKSYFCPINIHVSNGKSQRVAAKTTNDNLKKLSKSVLSRLVFENEDKSFWTHQKLIECFPNVPVTLDYHHRLINNEGESELEAHNACVKTWNVKPLFHYSEGKKSKTDRAHSDYVESLPDCSKDVDVEIEAKQKNLALMSIMKKYQETN